MSSESRSQSELLDLARSVQLPNYLPAPVVLTRGEGCRVWDVAGKEYLDLSGGVAVNSVGHAHPKLAEAIAEQAGRLLHVSNLFYNDRAIELAAAIVARSAFDRIYFCNSGAEANESLLKLARRWHYEQGSPERTELVSAEKSFHGRTMGALTLTGQTKYHAGMGPMVPGVSHVPFNDVDALRAAVNAKTAAVLLEPLQAEGGLHVPDAGYLKAAREICDASGALLLFDEVQTGYGRLGTFLGAEQFGVVPDACSLAKGIGGGFPLGAIAVREKFANGLPPGSHATTFGGSALACAAGLAVLRIFDEDAVLENVARVGAHLGEALDELVTGSPLLTEARGLGLLRGVKVAEGVNAGDVIRAAFERGVALTTAGGDVIRFAPSLTVTIPEIDRGVDILRATLEAYGDNDGNEEDAA